MNPLLANDIPCILMFEVIYREDRLRNIAKTAQITLNDVSLDNLTTFDNAFVIDGLNAFVVIEYGAKHYVIARPANIEGVTTVKLLPKMQLKKAKYDPNEESFNSQPISRDYYSRDNRRSGYGNSRQSPNRDNTYRSRPNAGFTNQQRRTRNWGD